MNDLRATMPTAHAPPAPDAPPPPAAAPASLAAAVETQDALLIVANDLDRLQRLLGDAGQTLMAAFLDASGALERLRAAAAGRDDAAGATADVALVAERLRGAISALQFQDMATQLVDHVQRRLRHCADRLAADAMGDDDALVADAPPRPNPVTQDEMDAGSIELF